MANALDTMSRPTSNRCHTTGGTTANQGHRKKDTQTDFVDEISTIVTDFVDEIPSPDPGLTDTSVKAPPTIQPNHARQYANTVARGLTNKVPPKVLRERIRFVALEMIDRFRYIRTLDLAASCFAERPFPAAIAAAQRAMRGLKADGLVMEYVTDPLCRVGPGNLPPSRSQNRT